MRRRLLFIGLTVALLAVPVGASWAQTTTTSSTTATTVASTTTTTVTSTTLPICSPTQTPAPRVGENCQLPGLECIANPNPPPHCPPPNGPPVGAVSVEFGQSAGTTGTTGGTTTGRVRPILRQPNFTG